MEGLQIKRILWIIFFLAFAAVSCWATQESLHLLLPSWPAAACWIVTVGIFVIASYGTKMIVDSFNQNIYLEHRYGMLIFGIVIVLCTWLFFSLPTNTHTFFYHSAINNATMKDLAQTKGYLLQLRDNVKSKEDIQRRTEQLRTETMAQLTALENEIDNIANPGFGDRARALLGKIAAILTVGQIPELSHRVMLSPSEKKDLKTQYRKMVTELLKQRQSELQVNYSSPQEKHYRAAAGKALSNIEKMESIMADKVSNGEVDANAITQANVALRQGYDVLKTYQDFVPFTSQDKEHYLAENAMTVPTRMLSVIDVWKDYLKGAYEGQNFIFWIFIAIVVDLAAFIFFDLAFKREE